MNYENDKQKLKFITKFKTYNNKFAHIKIKFGTSLKNIISRKFFSHKSADSKFSFFFVDRMNWYQKPNVVS